MRSLRLTLLFALAGAVAACDSATGPSGTPFREVQYGVWGGFTGRSQELEVWSDGRVTLSSGGPAAERRVTPQRLARLRAIVHAAEFRALRRSYVPAETCCDRTFHRIVVAQVQGTQLVEWLDHAPQPVLDEARAELVGLMAEFVR